ITCPHLLATVAHLAADNGARLTIDGFLLRRELLRRRPAARRTLPAGEFLVAGLCVEMSVSVEGVDTDPCALGAEGLEVITVGGITRSHQTLALGERLCLVDELALFQGADGDLALPPALGPGILEDERVTPIRPLGDDLDRLFAAQAEGGLQTQ